MLLKKCYYFGENEKFNIRKNFVENQFDKYLYKTIEGISNMKLKLFIDRVMNKIDWKIRIPLNANRYKKN